MNNKHLNRFTQSALAVAIASATLSAHAMDFSTGDWKIRWGNTVSYGAGWRLENPDGGQVMQYGTEDLVDHAQGSSYNYDDGTLNFEKGDLYTEVAKLSTELELGWQNFGMFVRGRAYYDTELVDGERPWKDLPDASVDAAGKGGELMDAFVWADVDIADRPATLRYGRQVLNWGESTFIQNGVNSINPVDVSALRRPGAEVKEALLPVEMAYASLGISDDLTVEAFYQIKWEKTRIDPCGTFFSTSDFVADGCGPVTIGGSKDTEELYLALRDAEIAAGNDLANRTAPIAERLPDDEPDDKGQYGLALRWFAKAIDTELGFYYMNLHSRLPYINGVVTNYDRLAGGIRVNEDPYIDSAWPLYQIAFPEDIKIAGLSFATSTESGWALSGEISVKQDYPVQWNAFELITGGVGLPLSRLYQARLAEVGGDEEQLFGSLLDGFDRYDVWQAQVTMIRFFDRVMGADKLNLAAEFGINSVPDLPSLDEARYGRSGAYGLGTAKGVIPGQGGDPCLTGLGSSGSGANENSDYCTNDGYVDDNSAGLRVRASLDYNDAIAGWNISPNASLAYDWGNSPDVGQQFLDQRLVGGLGVKFVYLNKYEISSTYTYFNNDADYNQLEDRDNITLSAAVSF